jgi:hypothetical protein
MNYRILGDKAHDYIHFIALAGLAFGLPMNKVVMSLSMMVGLLNLLVQANFKLYWKQIKEQHLFLVIASFWLLHVVGLIWTTEFDFALNDIRIKLPLIVIPLLFTVQPIQSNTRKVWLLRIFIASLLITSLYNYFSYHQLFGYRDYNDIRGLSLFGSHIRYGILIALGAVICLYSFFTSKESKIINGILFAWFVYYTYFSQIISGSLALFIGMVSLVFLALYSSKKINAYLLLLVVILIPSGLIIYNFSQPVKSPITEKDLPNLPNKTREGNEYIHYFVDSKDSKGNYLFIHLCEPELRREWNKISSIDYDSIDKKGQKIRFTLIRYMTSMGLKKDAESFHRLNQSDLKNIEAGIAEKEDSRAGLMARINGIRYQLLAHADPNGHSLLQRIEYWKTGMSIIKSHWIFGVGTGDIQVAFDDQYETDQSKLSKENRLRAHNTYLTVWVTFGILSLLFFYMIGKFLTTMIADKNFLGLAFITIAIITFLIEDTLETQTGVTFFSFFYGLFMSKVKN